MSTLNPTASNVYTAIRAFLLQELPSGTEVVFYIPNRVPEPRSPNFVIMAPLRRDRIATNVHSYADVRFRGSIAGTVLTVTAISFGVIKDGAQLLGTGIDPSTRIVFNGGGVGGIGTYKVTVSQTVASIVMASGQQGMLQSTKLTIQLDIHGPDSEDNAQKLSTLLRDEYSEVKITELNPHICPLYADDPISIPFVNDQQQYEFRWIVTALFEVDATVTVSQEYADAVSVGIINVDAVYPP